MRTERILAWWIRQAVSRAIADQARTIRLPVHMIEIVNKLVRTQRQIVQTLGREPTSTEIAQQIDIPESKVRRVRKIMRVPISLETPIGQERDSHLGDLIEDHAGISPAEAVVSVNVQEQTAQVLRTLSRREENIILMSVWYGGWLGAHTGGGRSRVFRYARAHSPDRS